MTQNDAKPRNFTSYGSHPMRFASSLIGLVACHFAFAQQCQLSDAPDSRLIEYQSEIRRYELSGFFPYSMSADSDVPVKYQVETWSGTGNYKYRGFAWLSTYTNINYSGSWSFSALDFTDTSTKTTTYTFSDTGGGPRPGGDNQVKSGLDGGTGPAPGTPTILGPTSRNFIDTTPLEHPPFDGTFDWGNTNISESLSDDFTEEEGINRGNTTSPLSVSNDSLQYGEHFKPATWGAAKLLSRTKPVTFYAQRVGFRVRLPKAPSCGGEYKLVLHFEEWTFAPGQSPASRPAEIQERTLVSSTFITLSKDQETFWPYDGTYKKYDDLSIVYARGRSSKLVSAELVRVGSCSQLPPGDGTFALGSVDFNLSLGHIDAEHMAAVLSLKAPVVSTELFTPAALQLTAHPSVTVVKDSNQALRQISAPEVVIDIETLDEDSYIVRSYKSTQAGTPDPATGLRPLTDPPLKSYRFDGSSSGGIPSLTITPSDNPARAATYSYDPATRTISMGQSGADRVQTLVTSRSGNTTTELRTIRNNAGTLVASEKKIYTAYTFGQVLTSLTKGTGADAQTTTTEYYTDNPSSQNYGRVSKIREPSGNWTSYSYDTQGRILTEARRYLNNPHNDPAYQTFVRFTYDTIPDEDEDGLPEKRITRVEKTLNIETARSYEITFSATETFNGLPTRRTHSILATAPEAAWDAQHNLVTVTRSVASGPYADKPASSLSSDGTLTLYTYSTDALTGRLTTTVENGHPNPEKTDVIAGTRVVTTTDSLERTVDQTTSDIATLTIIDGYTVTERDYAGRAKHIDYLDETFEERTYECCGVKSETDRQGRTTTYDYDELGRLNLVIRNGLKTRYIYDAAGNRTTTIRVGTDNSEITLQRDDYDTAGRLWRSTDARDRVTLTSYQNLAWGGMQVTVTGPGGAITTQTTAADGRLLKVEGNATAWLTYGYAVNADGTQSVTEYFPAAKITDTAAWRRSTTDFLGRLSTETTADDAVASRYYDDLGRLSRTVDADNVQTLYAYDREAGQSITALEVANFNTIDYAGADRISRITTAYGIREVGSENIPVRRTTTEVWKTLNDTTPFIVSTTEITLDGLQTWQIRHGENPATSDDDLTSHRQTVYSSGETQTDTVIGPDGTKQVNVSVQGRLQSTTVTHPVLGPLSSTSYDYDAHRRLWHVYASTGTTTYAYFDDDQVKSVTTPDPDDPTSGRTGPGYDPQTTTYESNYTSSGRVDTVTHPDNTVTTTEYYPSGQVYQTYGSRTYPQAYTYDAQQRVKTLTTWQDYAAKTGAATTTWNYDPRTGRLLNKRDASEQGASYTYTDAGRLKTRTWARTVNEAPLVTTYGYTEAGDLETIDYSDGTTPNVVYSYDRLGRLETTTDAAGLLTRSYKNGRLDDETYTGTGLLSGQSITRGFDDFFRLETLAIGHSSLGIPSIGYIYDEASRLETVTQGTRIATQTYHDIRGYPETMSITNGGTLRLAATRTLDNLGRVTSMVTPGVSSTTYEYNAANQRIKATALDNAYWTYGYDALGQVTSAVKRHADATPRPGHNFGYVFDDIGNRTETTLNNLTSIYAPNLKNQYLSRSTPPAIPVLGTAATAATVQVNDQIATNRAGDWFYHELALDGSGAPQYLQFPVSATTQQGGTPPSSGLVRSEVRNTFVPASPEAFEHDADGNLTRDGRWEYTWDAENRLIGMKTRPDLVTAAPGIPYQRLTFTYDAQGRRIGKKLETYTASWATTYERRFLYDGWNLVVELDWNASTSTFTVNSTFAWGLDLSGTTQGAGGVGGLLWASVGSTTCAPAYDGNGNIIAWIDIAAGNKAAENDYDPFGNVIQIAGTNPLPFSFSTKYLDSETGLNYYGYRYYNPSSGRWLGRDPVEEQGGINLHEIAGNNPVNAWDILGKISVWNHELSQEFADKFLALGIDVHESQYGYFISEKDHKIVHGKKGIMIDINVQWENFFKTIDETCADLPLEKKRELVLEFWKAMRNNPVYQKIRERGAAIPEGLHYLEYSANKELRALAIKMAFEAKAIGMVARAMKDTGELVSVVGKRIPYFKILFVLSAVSLEARLEARGYNPAVAVPVAALDYLNPLPIDYADAHDLGEAIGDGAVIIINGVDGTDNGFSMGLGGHRLTPSDRKELMRTQ